MKLILSSSNKNIYLNSLRYWYMDEYFVEEKTTYDRILDFLVFLAVFVVTIFLILDVFRIVIGLESVYLWVSVVVLIIFVLDLIRLRQKADGWGDFFKHNFLDILATIPFELFALLLANVDPSTVNRLAVLKWFRVTRLARSAKLANIARVSKITKEFKAAAHMKEESEKFKEKNRV